MKKIMLILLLLSACSTAHSSENVLTQERVSYEDYAKTESNNTPQREELSPAYKTFALSIALLGRVVAYPFQVTRSMMAGKPIPPFELKGIFTE